MLERTFHIERSFIKGMPHTVEYGLPGGCDEVYSYAMIVNKAYANLQYDIAKNKLCKTTEGGSTDSPDGVDMKEPNCGAPKEFQKASDESKFVKTFEATFAQLKTETEEIPKDCSIVYGIAPKIHWERLELYEAALLNFRDQFKHLGYEISTKDALDDKPKSAADKVGDTVSSILWGIGALVGGFFILDYVYEKAPSKAVGQRYQSYVKKKDVEADEARLKHEKAKEEHEKNKEKKEPKLALAKAG